VFRPRILPALLAALCVCPGAVRATSDPYADFRIPDHRWSAASGDYHFDWSHDKVDSPGEQFRRGAFNSTIVTSGMWASESDQWLRQVDAFARANGARSYLEDERQDSFGLSAQEQNSRVVRGDLGARLLLRAYPWAAPLGFTMFGQAGWTPSIDWQSSDATHQDPPNEIRQHSNTRDMQSSEVVRYGAGVGLGRVRDATPVYQAQRLEEELRRLGALSRRLRSRTREQLAEWFALQPNVIAAHERPDKYFWGEIERILQKDGALRRGSLDAFTSFRLAERGITQNLPLRLTGFFIGPVISGVDNWAHTRHDFHASAEQLLNGQLVNAVDFSSHSGGGTHSRDFARLGGTAEWHRPLGERWQLDFQSVGDYSAGLHILDVQSVAQAQYMIADRWLVTGSLFHEAQALEEPHTGRITGWLAGSRAQVHYFLEDRWSLNAAFVTGEVHDATQDRQQQSLEIGVSRWFTGLLSAPGILPPMQR